MQKFVLVVFLTLTSQLFSQDSLFDFFQQIDTTEYKTFFKKSKLPKLFLDSIELVKKDIANPKEKVHMGCLGGGKKRRLNWICKKGDLYLISISFGGRAYYTKYYHIDFSKQQTTLTVLQVMTSNRTATFGQVVALLKSKNYKIHDE